MDPDDVNNRAVMKIFEDSPRGGTPLCSKIKDVVNEITPHAKSLRDAGHMVAVIIITDGEASDGDLAVAMRPLAKLPVVVVIRLCTDEEAVQEYWNGVDQHLELDLG